MSNIVVITPASSGFGALIARTLADAGHIIQAGMRQTTPRNAAQAEAAAAYSKDHGVNLRSLELDVAPQESGEFLTRVGLADLLTARPGDGAAGSPRGATGTSRSPLLCAPTARPARRTPRR
ncbi:hypothetical protein [Streptomyces cavernae]|uniref:hypothetical protein n=1 Tax=Streptomyces cavernae TaxID=2259034 RepID=UPI000FEB62F6|nr:hypothetical protein [Streptomyces cavernae]